MDRSRAEKLLVFFAGEHRKISIGRGIFESVRPTALLF